MMLRTPMGLSTPTSNTGPIWERPIGGNFYEKSSTFRILKLTFANFVQILFIPFLILHAVPYFLSNA